MSRGPAALAPWRVRRAAALQEGLGPEREYDAAKARRQRRSAAQTSSPIVVYAMGKSGTTAIAEGLLAADHWPVQRIHTLRRTWLDTLEQEYRRTDPEARPLHVWDGQHLADHPATPRAPWTVITSVRDPIGQAVAKFFQSGERLGHIHTDSTVASLEEAFAGQWKLPIDWFDMELGACVGLDVYAHPFDPGVGWGTIETPSVRCLLLRMESMDHAPDALGRHLGAAGPIPIRRSNTAAEKGYSALYRAFRERVRPPETVIEAAYSSRMARHFYSAEEIEGFRRYWTRGEAPDGRV